MQDKCTRLTEGSLFAGIGGWALACRRAGVKTLWASEIEKFPIEVMKRHFPDVEQLGDINLLSGEDLPPVDIITAGSPCQDLSVAGKREGLDGARSGLFRRAIDIFFAMRKKTGNRYPRFFVWENVPGAFSSNGGMDFQTVLEEITRFKVPMPRSGVWAKAGMVRGPRCECAWRVLDAQHWGVPQRRKRIFLVADFGGRCAAKVLFKPEGMPWDNTEGKGTWESNTGRLISCPDASGKTALCFEPRCPDGGPRFHGAIAPTLTNTARGGQLQPCVFKKLKSDNYQLTEVGSCLTHRDYKDNGDLVLTPQKKVYSIVGNIINRKPENGGNGIGFNENVCFTLTGVDRHAVAFTENQRGEVRLSDKCNAITVQGGKSGQGYAGIYIPNVAKTLMAKHDGYSNGCSSFQIIATGNMYEHAEANFVRRLTPLEFERLQGLPDGWTEGGSDAARYKAIGNGMAQPCADFVIASIVREVQLESGDCHEE